jgi:hypothetical protein
VAIATTFGPGMLESFKVWLDEAVEKASLGEAELSRVA